MYIHSSTIQNSQKEETAQMSINRWINKLWSIHTLDQPSKEGNPDADYDMNEPCKHYAQWNKPDRHKRTNIAWFHLYEAPRVVRFIETESRVEVAKGWGRGGELLFNRDRVDLSNDESFGYRSWWWVYSIVNVFNATELSPYKWLKW